MGNKGRVIVAITSSAPRMAAPGRSANNLTKAVATVDHIQVLQVGAGAKGWINVASTNQNVDLLALRNASPRIPQIVADTQLPVGQYQRIKFHISKITLEDNQGNKAVYTPSNNVEFDAPFTVTAKNDTATTVVLDIPLDDSVRTAVDDNGRPTKVFAPVINYENRGDSQVTTANKKLAIQKLGVLQHQGNVAMDVNGQMDKGNGIAPDSSMRIKDGKVILADDLRPQPPSFVPPLGPGPAQPPEQVVSEIPGGPQISDMAELLNTPWKAKPALLNGKYNRLRM